MLKNIMKIKFLAGMILFGQAAAFAAPLVSETPGMSWGSTSCVSISTSAWTASTSSNLAGRAGLFVVNKTTNTVYGTETNTDSISTTAFLFPATSMTFLPLADNKTLYLLETGAGAETVCVKEVKQ